MTAKQVPLTIYKRGVRTELGMIQVEDDGAISGQIQRDHWELVKELYLPTLGEFSMNPVSTPVLDIPYHDIQVPKI